MAENFNGYLKVLEHAALVPASCKAVLLVGSAARGWANPGSDYDIYLVSTEMWFGERGSELQVPLDPPTVGTAVVHPEGRRWELKYWLDVQVDQMLAKVSWDQYARGLVAGHLLSEVEEIFLERLVTSISLKDQAWLEERRSELDNSAFKAFVITRSLACADDSIEDALGQLQAGDAVSAVLSARRAFGHTVDAILASSGEYGHYTSKWRARRMQAINPKQLEFAEYWNIETMCNFDSAAPREWVESVVAACRRLSMNIVIPERRDP